MHWRTQSLLPPPPPIKEGKKYNGQKSKSANADKILKNIQMNDSIHDRSSVIIETTIWLIEVIVNYDKWNTSTERIALCWYNRKSEMIHRKGNTQSKVSKIFTY